MSGDASEVAVRHPCLAIFVVIAAGSLLVGCDLKAPRLPGGLADRCADILKAAMPSAEFDIGKRTSESPSIDKIIAHVEGTRADLPEASRLPPDLAVECEFTNNVLTAFRWTKGGPK